MCEHTRVGRLRLQNERERALLSAGPRTPTQTPDMDNLVCSSSLWVTRWLTKCSRRHVSHRRLSHSCSLVHVPSDIMYLSLIWIAFQQAHLGPLTQNMELAGTGPTLEGTMPPSRFDPSPTHSDPPLSLAASDPLSTSASSGIVKTSGNIKRTRPKASNPVFGHVEGVYRGEVPHCEYSLAHHI